MHDTGAFLGDRPKPRDLRAAGNKLEGTYLIRMFAEFETAIRSFWRTIRPHARHTPMEVPARSRPARRGIPKDVIARTQAVRDFRNSLVHERNQAVEAVTIGAAGSPHEVPKPTAGRVACLKTPSPLSRAQPRNHGKLLRVDLRPHEHQYCSSTCKQCDSSRKAEPGVT